jgi:hypothetical protein
MVSPRAVRSTNDVRWRTSWMIVDRMMRIHWSRVSGLAYPAAVLAGTIA